MLRTDYSFTKFFFLGLLTLGIYNLIVFYRISEDINYVAKVDGRRTMSYLLVLFVFSWLTFGILPLVWWHNLCERMGEAVRRRNINVSFGASDYWIYNILLRFTIVCPLLFCSKLLRVANLLNADYNEKGE